MSYFRYIPFNDEFKGHRDRYKVMLKAIESAMVKDLGKLKTRNRLIAISKLEEFELWIGKCLRDKQCEIAANEAEAQKKLKEGPKEGQNKPKVNSKGKEAKDLPTGRRVVIMSPKSALK